MANILDELLERGYIKQFTHEDETRELLEKEKITFYIGFDPTADSLHVGHFIAMMFMAHMQKAGHRPIALLGGGTAMVGDPSGKTDMRSMLTKEQIEQFCTQYSINCKFKEVSEASGNYKSGDIIAQSRPRGTQVTSGASLTITIYVKEDVAECNPNEEVCE